MLPVSIIGGYLGAGKTTLVNHLLRHAAGRRLAVLVNEFGALPIDEDLIEAEDDTLISIAGGCICCSYGNDLMDAMLNLARLEPRPDHVLVEASGVALPGAIAASVSLLDGFLIAGVVVVVGADTIRQQADDPYVGDTVCRQLADADLVLLNKSKQLPEARLRDVRAWLSVVTNGAAVVPCDHARVPVPDVLYHAGRSDPGKQPGPVSQPMVHQVDVTSQIVQFRPGCNPEDLARRLAAPETGVIRAKGFVQAAQGLQALQVVERQWSVTDAPPGAEPGVVLISRTAQLDLRSVSDLLESPYAG